MISVIMFPKPIKNPNTDALTRTIEEYFAFLESEYFHEDGVSDYKDDIVEVAVKTFYENAWEWINQALDEQVEKLDMKTGE